MVAVALLPGALYVWAFERQAGRFGVALSDRLLRFVGGSAVLHALFAPLTYWFVAEQWERVGARAPLPWWCWPLVVGYVALPMAAGTATGRATRRGARWSRLVTGPEPAPRAWDHLFRHEVDGWIRCKLKSGVWIGGAFADSDGRRSYAAGYPEPCDLYLAVAADVDPETGEFVVDDAGDVVLGAGGLLVRWEEVEYLEFIDA